MGVGREQFVKHEKKDRRKARTNREREREGLLLDGTHVAMKVYCLIIPGNVHMT